MGVVVKEKKRLSQRILKCLIGKYVKISYSDMELLLESDFETGSDSKVKVLDVTDEWIRIEYVRRKENSLLKKETVVKLIDINAVDGFEIEEEDE